MIRFCSYGSYWEGLYLLCAGLVFHSEKAKQKKVRYPRVTHFTKVMHGVS